MATAPVPGSYPRPDDTDDDTPGRVLVVTMHGESKAIDFDALGPADDLITRQATGFPVSSFLGSQVFGSDSLLILWWVARRKNGEPNLTFAKVLAEFPTIRELEAANPDVERWTADELEDADPS